MLEGFREFGIFLRDAYRTSVARPIFRLILHLSSAAGTLSLLGLTIQLFDVTLVPPWLLWASVVIALAAFGVSVLQGAHVLVWNARTDRRDALIQLENDRVQQAGMLSHVQPAEPTSRSGANILRNVTIRDNGGSGIYVGRGSLIDADEVEVSGNRAEGIKFE